MAVQVESLITQFVQRGVGGLRSDLQAIGKDFDSVEGKADRLSRVSDRLLGFGAAGAGALALVGVAAIRTGGNLESVQAGLTSMLGSADKATAKIKELQNFAATTPFDFEQSAKAAQQLLAMGFTGEELIPTMKAVGNAVGAAGGTTEDFKGVLLALGQIKTKGKLSSEELNQMAERGIPALAVLQKELGLTKKQLQNLGNEAIDVSVALPALLKGLGELGGGTALDELSETLPGKISNLEDSVSQLTASVSKLFSQDAKDFIGQITDLTDRMRSFVETNPTMAKGILASLGVAAGATVALGVAGKVAQAINEVTQAAKNARGAKDALAGATKADTAAEAAKALVAGREEEAIEDVAETALKAGKRKRKLGEETVKATQKASAFSRVMNLLKKPLWTEAQGDVLNLRKGAFRNKDTGRFFSPSDWNAARKSAWRHGLYAENPPASAWGFSNMMKAQGLFGTRGLAALRMPTAGSAGIGAALGVGAGMGVRSDLKYLGYADSQVNTAAIATGIGAAALAAFNPAAAALILAAEGIRLGVNHFYSDRLDAQARAGNGVDADPDLQAKLTASSTPGQKAAVYLEQRDKLLAKGDTVGAESARLEALKWSRQQKRLNTPGTAENMAEQERRFKAWTAELDKQPREPESVRLARAQEAERAWRNAQANGQVRPGEDKGQWFLRQKKAQAALPEEAKAAGRVQRVGQRLRIRFDELTIEDPAAGQYDDQVAAGYG